MRADLKVKWGWSWEEMCVRMPKLLSLAAALECCLAEVRWHAMS